MLTVVETYGMKEDDSNFQFFQELPVTPQVDGVVGTLSCVKKNIILVFCALRSHFWILRMQNYLYKVSFFMYDCVHFHYFGSTLCVYVMWVM